MKTEKEHRIIQIIQIGHPASSFCTAWHGMAALVGLNVLNHFNKEAPWKHERGTIQEGT